MELSNKILSEVICKYNKGSTLNSLSLEYETTRYKLKSILEKHNVKIRKKGSKYIFDEDVFENIDSENKAYWLGFIYADGCIMKKNGGSDILMFTLKKSDFKHLYKFCDLIRLDKEKVKIYKDTVRLEISSNKIVEDLKKHGVTYRKTFKVKYPKIDKNLMKHFIRGYFDGDGCLTISESNKIFKLIGTEDLIKNIQNYFIESIEGITETKIIEDSNMFNYYKNGAVQTLKIMDHIYSNPRIFLNRKMKTYKKLKNKQI